MNHRKMNKFYFKISILSLLFITTLAYCMEEAEEVDENSEFFEAAENGDETTLRALIQAGHDVNAFGYYKVTALHRAARGGNLSCCKILLKSGAKIDQADDYGNTALHNAAHIGHVKLVEFLLDSGALADCIDTAGRTPLIIAGDSYHIQNRKAARTSITLLLVKKGANVNYFRDDSIVPEYYCALMRATYEGNWEAVKILLNAGAKTTIQTHSGVNTLMMIASHNWGTRYNRHQLHCCELIVDRMMKIPTIQQVEKVFVIGKLMHRIVGNKDLISYIKPFLHAAIEAENREYPDKSIAFHEINKIENDFKYILMKKYKRSRKCCPSIVSACTIL